MSHNIWRRWVSRLFKKNLRARPRKDRRLSIEWLEDRVVPATDVWISPGVGTGNVSLEFWSTATNWSLGRAPITGDTVDFGSSSSETTTIDNLTNNPTLAAVNISSSGYTLSGDPLVVSGTIDVSSSVTTATISQAVDFLPPPATPQVTIEVDNGSSLTLGGPISALSSVGVTKTGVGTLVISNSNAGWLGTFTLAAAGGTVEITNAQALGSTNVTVNTDTQLQLDLPAPGTITNSLTVNGSGLVGDGAILDAAGNDTWTGTVVMDSDTTFGASAGTTFTISGPISDNGQGHNLTKEGAGTLVFPNANTYRGDTIINNGILEIENPLSLGAGANALSSNSGSSGSETIVNYNPTANEAGTLELNLTPADPIALSTDFSGGVDPNAILQNPKKPFNPTTNTIVGFQVYNDILVLNGPGFNGSGALFNAAGNNEWDGSVILGSVAPNLANPYINSASGTNLVVSGVVSDPNQASSVTKIGAGELVFTNANTYRGSTLPTLNSSVTIGTYVDQGTLDITDSQALGTGQVLVYTGASLQLDVDSGFDGTAQRTHGWNLGFDSVTGTGPGQELVINGTAGSFTLGLGGQVSSAITITDPNLLGPTGEIANAVKGLLTLAGEVGETVSNVTQDGNVYRILFSGSRVDIPLMTVASSTVTLPTGPGSVTVNPIYGLTVSNSLFIDGTGVTGSPDGAIDSHTGLNRYVGTITNGNYVLAGTNIPYNEFLYSIPLIQAVTATAAIGVDADVPLAANQVGLDNLAIGQAGHPLADNDYLQWDYSLTVSGLLTGGDLVKTGAGDLILPNANTYGVTTGVYTPATDIQQGWITISNSSSLGPNAPPSQSNVPQTLEHYIEIDNSGALHLDPLPGQSLIIYNNFLLNGLGLTSQNYGLIEQAGAIENLTGDNTLAGIIQLNGTAGIGVEQIPATSPNPPNTGFLASPPTSPPLTASQLTLTGYLWNFVTAKGVTTNGGLTKLGSRRLIIQGSGTYTGNVDVKAGVLLDQNSTALGAGNNTSTNPPTVTVESGAALEFGNSVNEENVGNGIISETGGVQEGVEVFGEHLILNGAGDPTFDDSALNALASNNTPSNPTVYTVTVTGSTTGMFNLSFSGLTGSATFNAGANASALQQGLNQLLSANGLAGSVTVAQYGNVFTITYSAADLIGLQLQSGVSTPFTGTFAIVNAVETGSLATSTLVSPSNDPIVATDTVWYGPVTLATNTTVTADTNPALPGSESASRLIFAGSIGDNAPVSPPSNLTILGGGEVDLDGANTYGGTTYIQQGVTSIGNPNALGSTGIGTPETQTLSFTGVTGTTPSFVLDFTGYNVPGASSGPNLTAAIPYTGVASTDASAIQSALDTILATSGGETDSAGSVTVNGTGSGTSESFTVTFGGTLSGFPINLLSGMFTKGTGTIAANETQAGTGGTVVENSASMEVAGSFTVAGEPLLLEGNGTTQDIQTLTLSNTTTGTFTLSFSGPDTTGNTVTDTTGTLNVTSPTLASDIQNALNSLQNIGGVGGLVTVTAKGPGIYQVAFGGTLSGQNVSALLPNTAGLAAGTIVPATAQAGSQTIAGVPTQWFEVGPAPIVGGTSPNGGPTQTDGSQPVSGQITSEAVDPQDPTILYVGTAGGGVWKSIDSGVSWHPLFDAIPEIQTLTIAPGTTGSFALNFVGPNSDGITNPSGNTTINLNAASPTLASDIQNALDALGNIGGVGGQVTVTQDGNTYEITFNGTLAGLKVNQLLVTNSALTAGSAATQVLEIGGDPALAMYVGAVTVDPFNSNILYVGTGVLENSNGQSQFIAPVTNEIATDSYYGTGVYESTDGGLTWSLLLDNTSSFNGVGNPVSNPVTGSFLVNPFYGMGISAIAIDPDTADPILNPGTIFAGPNATYLNPTIYVADGQVDGAGLGIKNDPIDAKVSQGVILPGGTGQLAGVWRFSPDANLTQPTALGTWFDLTDYTSSGRSTLKGKQNAPPGAPGPDDDFRINFPESGDVRWTDVQVIDTGFGNDGETGNIVNGVYTGAHGPVLYAALGSPGQFGGVQLVNSFGQPNYNSYLTPSDLIPEGANGVYRAYFPESNQPTWYIGDPGTPSDQVETITIVNTETPAQGAYGLAFNGFKTGVIVDNPTGNDAGEIQAELSALPSIGPGNVSIALASQSGDTTTYSVTFVGQLANVGLPLLQAVNVDPFMTVTIGLTTAGGGVDSEQSGTEFPTSFIVGINNGVDNGNIQISVFPGNTLAGVLGGTTPTIIYASVANAWTGNLNAIYVSRNGGLTWSKVTAPEDMNGQGNHANDIVVDPTNSNIVYIGGASANIEDPTGMIFVSLNGGTTWTDITKDANGNSPHNAVHALEIDGTNAQGNSNIIVGTDGGIWHLATTIANPTTTPAPLDTWSDLNSNLAIAQVNGVSAAQSNPQDLVAGTEDNGLSFFSGFQAWTESDTNGAATEGPSGGLVYIDPDNPNIVYAVISNPPPNATASNLLESTNGGLSWSPVSTLGGNFGFQDFPYFPFLIDPLNTSRILVGGQGLRQSLNGGLTWLTLNGQSVTAMAVAGYQGAFVQDPQFPDVSDIGANQDDPNTIYISNGRDLLVTKDLGLKWVNRAPLIAAGSTIESITVNPANRDNVFVTTQGSPGLGENQLFESTDGGQSWTVIAGANSTISGLGDIPLWQMAIDPRTGTLYIGTDNGVYSLTNAVPLTAQGPAATPATGTIAWTRFGIGMPNVSVHTLSINLSTNTLLAGTWGRGVYELYLDASETSPNPVSAGMVGLSGSSFWSGPVALVGDANTNSATIGADGTQGLPDGITAASINFVNPITDALPGSNPTLNKTGDGDVIFSGSNAYGGMTYIEQGNLVADNLTALGSNTNGTTVVSGATLELLTNLNAEPVTLYGNGSTFDGHSRGALLNVSGTNTFTGTITLPDPTAAENVTIGAESGSEMILQGTISGGDSMLTMAKEGTGTVVLDDSNTYLGTTAVYQGSLVVENSNAFSDITEPTNTVDVLDGAQVVLQTPTGGSSLNVANPLFLAGTGVNDTGALEGGTGTNIWSGAITLAVLPGFSPYTLSSGAVALGAATGDTLTVTGAIGEEDSSTTGITVPVGLVKVGAGTVTLANSNTYTGSTTVAQGILDVQNPTALGSLSYRNNIQTITVPQNLTNVFTLGFEGVSTNNLNPASATLASDIQTQLNNILTGLGDTGSSVTVTTNPGAPETFIVTFTGPIAAAGATPLPLITSSGPSEQGEVTISGGVTIEQIVTLSDAGIGGTPEGDFTLSFDGNTASASRLPFGASATAVRNVLQGPTGTGGLFASAGTVQVIRTPVQTTTASGASTNPNGWVYTLIFGGGLFMTSEQVGVTATDGAFATSDMVAQGGTDVVVNNNIEGSGELALDNSALPAGSNLVVSNYTLTLNGTGPTGVGSLYNVIGNNTWSGPIVLATNSSVGVALPTTTLPTTPNSSLTLTDVESLSVEANGVVPSQPILNVAGPGTLIFPTNANYTAQTDFATGDDQSAFGILELSGGNTQVDTLTNLSTTTGIGPVELNGGTLSGNLGSVESITNFTPSSGGTIDPGDNYIQGETSGLLSSTGTLSPDVSLSANDTLYVDLTLPANTNDVLDVTGTINLNGATLNGLVNSAIPIGETYTIINAGSVVGQFANQGFASITPTEAGALSATVSYIDGVKFEVDYFTNHVDVIRKLESVAMSPITQSNSNPVYGDDELYSVTLTPEPGAPLVTGTVVFTVTDPLGNVTSYNVLLPTNPASGIATFDLATALKGTPQEGGSGYSVMASFSGFDANGNHTFGSASSGPVTTVFQPANSSVSLSLNYPQPQVYGEPFQLTASVATTVTTPSVALSDALAPAGSVSFYDGAVNLSDLLATVNLSSPPAGTTTATATLFSNGLLTEGNHLITAVYNPLTSPDNYNGSTNKASVSLHQATSSVTVTTPALSPPAVYGQAGVTFTATITPEFSGDPTGTVTFSQGAKVLGPGTISTTTLATGNNLKVVNQAGGNYYVAPVSPDTYTPISTNIGDVLDITGGTSFAQGYYQIVGVSNGDWILNATDPAPAPVGTSGGQWTLYATTASYTTLPGQLLVGSPATITATYSGDINFSASTGTLNDQVNEASTTVALASSSPLVAGVNTSSYGQSVTFTATVSPVAPGAGNPTGTVTFFETPSGGSQTELGTGSLNTVNGVTTATFTTNSLLPSSYNITASYGGDGNFLASTSPNLPQNVTKASALTTVTTSGPSVYGQPVVLTATISQPPGSGNLLPTGTVIFYVQEGTNLVPLNPSGQVVGSTGGVSTASYTTTAGQLPEGSDTIVAQYSGDTHYGPSSGSTTQSVSADNTTLLVTSSGPVAPGGTATIIAELFANTPGGGISETNGETVSFSLGSTPLGTGTISTTNNVTTASITVSASSLPIGNNTITATYSGDTDFNGSQGTFTEAVQEATSVSVAQPTPSVFGQPVALTATITPSQSANNATPSGTVEFIANFTTPGTGTILGTAPVGTVGGLSQAVLQNVTNLPTGADTITAFYSGDNVFLASKSPPVSDTVSKDTTKTTLTASATSVELGQTVLYTATISVLSPGSGTPSGTVTFKNGATVWGTVNVVNGVATLQRAMGAAGKWNITATYSPGSDPNDLGSVGTLAVTVVAHGTRASTVTVASSSPIVQFGSPLTFTATVKDAGAAPKVFPTGTVSFFEGTTFIGSAALVKSTTTGLSTATFTPTTPLPVGTEQITATYNGNGTFAPKTSAAITQQVNLGTRSSQITLAASASAGTYGTAVTFTATVQDTGAAPVETPTGIVTFTATPTQPGVAAITMGIATVSGSNGTSTASLSYSALPVLSAGYTYNITATYSGDSAFSAEGSNTLTYTVSKSGAPTVTLTSTPSNSSVYGQPVAFNAAVSIPGSTVTPTGFVQFTNVNTGQTYAPVQINSNGVAVLTLASLPAGTTFIQATYVASANSPASQPVTIGQDVTQAATNMVLAPATATAGTSFNLTATVSAVAPGAGTPTGTVTFSINGTVVGPATVVNGVATITVPGGDIPIIGTYTVTAVYSGDSNFTGDTGTESLVVGGRGT